MALLPQESQKRQMVLLGLVPFVLAFAYYYFLYSPRKDTIADRQSQYEALDAKNRATEAQVARYGPNLGRQLQVYRQHLAAIEQLVPKRNDIPNLLVSMGEQAQAHQVLWGGFTPSVEDAGQYYSRQTYQISITGQYHDIGSYLAAVGSLPRIVKPTELKLSALDIRDRDPSLPPLLRALFNVETYVLPQPGEVRPDSTAGKGGAK